MPTQMCGPPAEGGVEERREPERPEPQPMSRISEGEGRARRARARVVMEAWTVRMREEVVYLRASASL